MTTDPRVARIVAKGFLDDWARRTILAFESAGLAVVTPEADPDLAAVWQAGWEAGVRCPRGDPDAEVPNPYRTAPIQLD